MPYFKDILDHEFIREHEVHESEVKDNKVNKSKTGEDNGEYLWEGQPDQKFRLWNSKGLKDTIISSFFVLTTLLSMWVIIFIVFTLFKFLGGNPDGGLFSRVNFFIWLSIAVFLLLFFLYFDIQEYLFRLGSKYFVSKTGIGFLLGYHKKKKYLIPWKDMSEISFSKLESRLYIKNDSSKNKKGNKASPNSTEVKKYPFIELKSKNEINQLLTIIRKYKRVIIK